jgi:alpha-mannosidase
MLKHSEATKGRLRRFAQEFKPLLYPEAVALARIAVYSAPGRIPYAEALAGEYRAAREGETFGPGWSTHWFRLEYIIPQEWSGREVLLHFNSTSEGCVWRDGVPLQGLTSYNWGPEDIRSYFILEANACGGEQGTVYVEAAINGMFGLHDWALTEAQEDTLGRLRHARIVVRDRLAWDLYWDFIVIKELAEELPAEGPFQGPALAAANEMANAVSLDDRSTFEAGRAVARKFFAAHNGSRNHHVSAIGHAHIDTAWLWPLAETQRKCYRSFSTAVRLMDDYPEYKFACSQAQQLSSLKESQPDLYEKIKARNGQFIPVGGTWVEPDCNIPSGESLVRQFLTGQRFFEKEFGSICREFWNPDVFGYSGALPQIMRGAGIKFFLTQKLSWNQFNRPTSSTFLWEGIDGSRVLTHFPPTDTYNGVATVKELLLHHTNFKDKERAAESCMLFGFGDGGGGPTEEMLERLRRMRDVPGLPEVVIREPQEFFARCEKDIVDPIVWSGELYFELHRGTYTTQAANKRDNRRSEEALHDLEFLSAMARQFNGAPYPDAEINRLWEIVLLNQFHDIIPGSSITEVYTQTARDYATVLGSTDALRADAIGKLLPDISRELGPHILALNTLSWPRREVISLPGGKGPSFAEAPAYGYNIGLPQCEARAPATLARAGAGFILENGLVSAQLDSEGRLISFFDKRYDREAIAQGGKGNQYVLFEDLPEKYDAWDMDICHLEKRKNVGDASALRVIEDHPLRVTVEVELFLSTKASLVQRITLTAESPRLDFEAKVDWREKNQFLKVEFPLALRSDHATYEIQFGHVRRPTHFNTSWDFARFEVSAHRWADLSEPNYGVALLNDSKYGYACHAGVLRLSLLRSPKSPDPMADMGEHRFRYALYPHPGGPQNGGVIPEAAAFNQPLQIFSTSAAHQSRCFFSVDNPSVVLDTVKKAEDSEDLILRLYESHGGRQTATLSTSIDIQSVARVNLLESEDQPVPAERRQIRLVLRPFELVTLKLKAAAGQNSTPLP